jgi:hypothetical protein
MSAVITIIVIILATLIIAQSAIAIKEMKADNKEGTTNFKFSVGMVTTGCVAAAGGLGYGFFLMSPAGRMTMAAKALSQ